MHRCGIAACAEVARVNTRMPPESAPPIEWNRVTLYSKLIAVVVFIFLVCAAFVFGLWYQKQLNQPILPVSSQATTTLSEIDNENGSKTITTIEYVNGFYGTDPKGSGQGGWIACSKPISA